MQYRYQAGTEEAVKHLVDVIKNHLKHDDKVLWLLSGGSNIHVAVAVAQHLHGTDLTNLQVSLVDERYGPTGHDNENWAQLIDAGFIPPGANLYRPLIDQSPDKTTRAFNAWLQSQFEQSDVRIGLLGIGSDGHIAGIKPHSVAVTSHDWAVYYKWNDYERITMTTWALTQLDQAIVCAMGTDKSATLQQLLTSDSSIAKQPAQVLKHIKASILYTDYKKEKA